MLLWTCQRRVFKVYSTPYPETSAISSAEKLYPHQREMTKRIIDLFKTKDGQTIDGVFLTYLFYRIGEVKQFQVIQESYDHIVVSIVERSPLPPEKVVFLERAIKDIMQSDVKVEFEFLDTIPLQPSGKYRFIISKVQ